MKRKAMYRRKRPMTVGGFKVVTVYTSSSCVKVAFFTEFVPMMNRTMTSNSHITKA